METIKNLLAENEQLISDSMKGSYERGRIGGLIEAETIFLKIWKEYPTASIDIIWPLFSMRLSEKRLELLNKQ